MPSTLLLYVTHVVQAVEIPFISRCLRRSFSALALTVDRHGMSEIDHAHLNLLATMTLWWIGRVIRDQHRACIEAEDILAREPVLQGPDLPEGALRASSP